MTLTAARLTCRASRGGESGARLRGRMTIFIRVLHNDVKRGAIFEAEDGASGLQGFDFRHEDVFFKVDALEALLEGELGAADGFEFSFLPTVA